MAPPSVSQITDITVTDPASVEVRDRIMGDPGCSVSFGPGVSLYLSAQVEAQLLALLSVRAPRLKALGGFAGHRIDTGRARLLPIMGVIGDGPQGAA